MRFCPDSTPLRNRSPVLDFFGLARARHHTTYLRISSVCAPKGQSGCLVVFADEGGSPQPYERHFRGENQSSRSNVASEGRPILIREGGMRVDHGLSVAEWYVANEVCYLQVTLQRKLAILLSALIVVGDHGTGYRSQAGEIANGDPRFSHVPLQRLKKIRSGR